VKVLFLNRLTENLKNKNLVSAALQQTASSLSQLTFACIPMHGIIYTKHQCFFSFMFCTLAMNCQLSALNSVCERTSVVITLSLC